MALEKQQKPTFPTGQFLQIFLFVAAIFVMLDPDLRMLIGTVVGYALNPVIGFNGKLPVLTILLAAVLMVGMSTGVRHFFVDWIKTARIQNVMRSFQKALREARVARNTKRVEQLQHAQPKLMGLQTELSKSQMKPMAFTFLIIIPLFAWLSQFIQDVQYPFYSAPWNPQVEMFRVAFLLPNWLLFYTAVSIPFGALVQKLLKYFSWRDRWHLAHPNVHLDDDEKPKAS